MRRGALAAVAALAFAACDRCDPGPAAPTSVRFDGIDAGERPPPSPSAGCRREAGAAPALEGTVEIEGAARRYELALPARYDPARPYPLVLAFHGSGGNGVSFRRMMRLEEVWGAGAIAIYPDAVVRRVWGEHFATHWGRVEDLPLFDALVRLAREELCVDERRVFAVGWSSGGYFANQLGCVRPDVVRAIAALSGGGPEDATCTRPVPAFFHHDRDDRAVLVTTGRASREAWCRTNRCRGEAEAREGCLVWGGDAPVVWCETSGNGHPPPPSVSEAVWRFLSAF